MEETALGPVHPTGGKRSPGSCRVAILRLDLHHLRAEVPHGSTERSPSQALPRLATLFDQRVKTIPSGRRGAPDDITDAVCLLVSERATYVSG